MKDSATVSIKSASATRLDGEEIVTEMVTDPRGICLLFKRDEQLVRGGLIRDTNNPNRLVIYRLYKSNEILHCVQQLELLISRAIPVFFFELVDEIWRVAREELPSRIYFSLC